MALLKNYKTTILVSILMLLVFIVTLLVPKSVSRYQNSKYGNGQTPVASWNVSATSSNSNINIIVGSTTSYTFTVNNASDVVAIYSIEVSNLPTGIQAKLDTGSYITESSNKIIFSQAGELGFTGTTQRTHTITFNAPLSLAEVSNRSISINVKFQQKIN